MAAVKRKRFQLTTLPLEERQRLAGYIKQLGGTLIDTQVSWVYFWIVKLRIFGTKYFPRSGRLIVFIIVMNFYVMSFLQIFSKQATHVICGKANRGEKYLGGCALGTRKEPTFKFILLYCFL